MHQTYQAVNQDLVTNGFYFLWSTICNVKDSLQPVRQIPVLRNHKCSWVLLYSLKKNTVWNSRQICGFSLYLRRDVYHNLRMVFRTIFIQYLFQEETVTRKLQTLLCLCVDYRWKRVQVRGSENSNTSESIFQHRMPEGSCPNPMCLKECHFKGKNTQ
jgi:hypothetical protein